MEQTTVPTEELEAIITGTGDRLATMFEQLMKGNWVDSMGHDVKMNKSMLDLQLSLVELGNFRAKHLGWSEYKHK